MAAADCLVQLHADQLLDVTTAWQAYTATLFPTHFPFFDYLYALLSETQLSLLFLFFSFTSFHHINVQALILLIAVHSTPATINAFTALGALCLSVFA